MKMPPITLGTAVLGVLALALLIVLSPLVILIATVWGARELNQRQKTPHAVAVGVVGVAASIAATVGVIALYSREDDSTTAMQSPDVVETRSVTERPATGTSRSSNNSEAQWLSRIRTANVQRDLVEITEVTVSFGVMRVHTSLGYAPDDVSRRGMAAQVCFDAQSAGWSDHIEVWAGGAGILAWTGSSNQGCRGY